MSKHMKSEVGESRKARIAALVAAGLDNDAIWAAMEHIYPQTIADNALRAAICKSKKIPVMDYDADERERLGWAIRQIKGLMLKEDSELNEVLEYASAGDTKSPDDIEFINRPRFQSGVHAMDFIYGHTTFRWTRDDPSGKYKKGDLMPVNPGDKNWVASEPKFAKVQHGLPEGFLSLWGGSPGVGKTRTAIALSKSLNRLGHKVLYFNGEADEMDFRMWLGADVDRDLFRVVSGELIRTEDSVAKIYKEMPKVVIFDSFQMLAEVSKGTRGAKTALSRFKVLKSDTDAGRPHIIFISQLNKKDELAGSRYIEHMVDFAARVTKIEGRKGTFLFECPRKNRGGETPRHSIFRHLENGIECLSTEFLQTPIYKLMQGTGDAVAGGVTNPADL
jgi:hypothetical protein